MLLRLVACESPRREICISAKRPPACFSRYCRRSRQMLTCCCWRGTSRTTGRPDEARALRQGACGSCADPDRGRPRQPRFRGGAEREIHQIMVDHGVCVLDGDTCEVEGVGFAGVKGFAGGFGRRALGPGASRSSSSSCTRR